MTLLTNRNDTLSQIVDILEEFPREVQNGILKQMRMKKALLLARKIDSGKKPKRIISDQEIADMIHDFRKWK